MYAIIRTGGKQTKVREGDVVDVERLRAEGKVEFTPLLVVDAKGKVFSKRDQLKNAKVEATVVGDSSGDKIDIFKYKNKTGYRRRQGHRQTYTTIQVTAIETGAKKAAKKAAKDDSEKAGKKKKKAKASSEEKAPKKAAKASKDKDEAATDPKAEAPAAETAAGDEEA